MASRESFRNPSGRIPRNASDKSADKGADLSKFWAERAVPDTVIPCQAGPARRFDVTGTASTMSRSGKGAAQMKFGRYNALTKLGQGAMATVYLAEDPALNRMVAIKVIHSHLSSNASLLDRFTVEAKTAAGLRNPNIVEIFDYGLEDEAQYLVMEYIDG